MEIQIMLPESLNEISLGQFMKYVPVTKDITDEVFLMEKTVELLCDVHLDVVRKLNYSNVTEIVSQLNKVMNLKPEFESTFFMNGIQYGFIPDIQDITFGEYIDLDTFLTDEDNLNKAMAVLYRPIKSKVGDSYSIEDYDPSTEKQMKQMPMGVALGSVFFFMNLNKELLANTMDYLTKEAEKLTQQQVQDLQNHGVGINRSIQQVKEMLPSLTQLQNYR